MRDFPLEFVRPVGAEEEFELQPDRMRVVHGLTAIVVVLQPDLGEFAGIPGQDG